MNVSHCLPVLLAGVLALPAVAGAGGGLPKVDVDPDVLTTESFLAAHPDLRWQREGMRSYEQGQYAIALTRFERAARHGDKLSQAMIATMHWDGLGVPVDRELAYIWMDIAAERMYPDLLVVREDWWRQLDEGQRQRAIERGQALLAEYGDEVAKPRQEQAMARWRRQSTGSRAAGTPISMKIIPFTGRAAQGDLYRVRFDQPSGMTLSGDQYYAERYWKPAEYWAMHDRAWKAPTLDGRPKVDVGRPEILRRSEGEVQQD